MPLLYLLKSSLSETSCPRRRPFVHASFFSWIFRYSLDFFQRKTNDEHTQHSNTFVLLPFLREQKLDQPSRTAEGLGKGDPGIPSWIYYIPDIFPRIFPLSRTISPPFLRGVGNVPFHHHNSSARLQYTAIYRYTIDSGRSVRVRSVG